MGQTKSGKFQIFFDPFPINEKLECQVVRGTAQSFSCFIASWRTGMILRFGNCVGRVEKSLGMFPESFQDERFTKSLSRLLLSSKSLG